MTDHDMPSQDAKLTENRNAYILFHHLVIMNTSLTERGDEMENERLVTIQEAMTKVGKSESTIYRLIKQHNLKVEKKKQGKAIKNFIDYRQLIDILRNDTVKSVSSSSSNGSFEGRHERTSDDKVIVLLETQVKDLKEELKEAKATIVKLLEHNRAQTEEIKGLLRNRNGEDQKRRSVAGYLIHKLMGD